MKRSKIALITVGCLMSLVSLAACSSEEAASPSSSVDRPATDAVILPPRRVTQTPSYVRPDVPAYTAQPVQPVQPVQPMQSVQPEAGGLFQGGLDILHDFEREAARPYNAATPNPDAELSRQREINNQLDQQIHYGNVSGYQRQGIRGQDSYNNHSKGKSYDPAGAP